MTQSCRMNRMFLSAMIITFMLPLAVSPLFAEPPRQGGPGFARDRDNNPPGPKGGPGTNWENRPGPRGGPGAGPDNRAENRREWLANHPNAERFDQNGDGRLNQAERKEARAAWQEKREERREAIDTNNDGTIDDAEKAAAREQWLADHPEQAKRMDVNGDGKVDQADREAAQAKRQERRDEAFAKADTNGDGTLDAAEKKAAQEMGLKRWGWGPKDKPVSDSEE